MGRTLRFLFPAFLLALAGCADLLVDPAGTATRSSPYPPPSYDWHETAERSAIPDLPRDFWLLVIAHEGLTAMPTWTWLAINTFGQAQRGDSHSLGGITRQWLIAGEDLQRLQALFGRDTVDGLAGSNITTAGRCADGRPVVTEVGNRTIVCRLDGRDHVIVLSEACTIPPELAEEAGILDRLGGLTR